MKNKTIRTIITALVFLITIGFLIVGMTRTHKVYDPDFREFALDIHEIITERQLVIDATFSGTQRQEGKLYSTYDRSEDIGKRACPT